MSIFKKCPYCGNNISILSFITSFGRNWNIKKCPHCGNKVKLLRSEKNNFIRGMFYGIVSVIGPLFFHKWFNFEIMNRDVATYSLMFVTFMTFEVISLMFSKLEKAPE